MFANGKLKYSKNVFVCSIPLTGTLKDGTQKISYDLENPLFL
jgi:hypothetical protein